MLWLPLCQWSNPEGYTWLLQCQWSNLEGYGQIIHINPQKLCYKQNTLKPCANFMGQTVNFSDHMMLLLIISIVMSLEMRVLVMSTLLSLVTQEFVIITTCNSTKLASWRLSRYSVVEIDNGSTWSSLLGHARNQTSLINCSEPASLMMICVGISNTPLILWPLCPLWQIATEWLNTG